MCLDRCCRVAPEAFAQNERLDRGIMSTAHARNRTAQSALLCARPSIWAIVALRANGAHGRTVD
eukprot:5388069-Prymnesium_polylepis.1